ncbi:glycosyltransferase [Hymenobacter volaticus]|uniref:Glycosyltransferase n=1 Tax=Hymenobacter volaticus TaxID=2932254 RepID=A0ABY4G8Y5_9BACT|nr:glycosyltransferase [Hymenobacter volaticus]UOQ67222.1 glycosyltransferase [Hymenobacter volaticus]
MRILFIGFWGISDPLTTSTTMPNLQILQGISTVETIVLATVERDEKEDIQFTPSFTNHKIVFRPLISRTKQPLLLNKIDDFVRLPRELAALVRQYDVDTIIGRGAMAGALAYQTSKRTGVRFFVESFEPHADYMLDSGVWKAYDPRYLFQRRWEEKEKKLAKGLMPVAENYRRKLIEEGVPADRIMTVSCFVDLQKFAFDAERRQQMRRQLDFPNEAIVGIYVGKFGDIYYDAEAFDIFRAAADHFPDRFRLIILTPNPIEQVKAKLQAVGLNETNTFVTKAPHREVPAYLAAADFAFAPIKPAECRQYCSPVKVGEYWASGLPVLLTEGVGDDSAIIKEEGGGAVFNLERPTSVGDALQLIEQQIALPDYRTRVRQLAEQHRSIEQAKQAYTRFFGT